VIFQLPGFTTAASGTPQESLDALRKANETSYFKDKNALWVKVISNGSGANPPYGGGLGGPAGAGNSVQVSRQMNTGLVSNSRRSHDAAEPKQR
jgi:cell migration-inducing and hyaluronan-binding protein